jgi:photosystem II stability/assembly factor-like uncharacterized protein
VAALAAAATGAGAAATAAPPRPADTWVPLAALPEHADGPVLALAADPANAERVVVGTASGSIYVSSDGGASWRRTAGGLGRGVTALAFDPSASETVLAGTRGDGAWRSRDGGQSWRAEEGTAGRTVRAFGFSSGVDVAGTDQGVLVAHQGGAWAQAGLSQVAVTAVAVALARDPARLLVGGDAIAGGGGSSQAVVVAGPSASTNAAFTTQAVPLFTSGDGGQTWAAVSGTAGGSSIVSVLAAAAPSGSGVLMGTNAGLFSSSDGGATWQPLTGDGTLPATDVTSLAYVPGRSDRYYVASDGGVSENGGVWVTRDGGAHFSSLRPPVPAVTALSISGSATPVLYAATLRPRDQAVTLWTYRDDGGAPRGAEAGPPAGGTGPGVSGTAHGRGATPHPAGGTSWLGALLRGPEAPYLGLAAVALLVLVAAMVAYLRRARDL